MRTLRDVHAFPKLEDMIEALREPGAWMTFVEQMKAVLMFDTFHPGGMMFEPVVGMMSRVFHVNEESVTICMIRDQERAECPMLNHRECVLSLRRDPTSAQFEVIIEPITRSRKSTC